MLGHMRYQLETIFFVDTSAIVKKACVEISKRLELIPPSEEKLNETINKPPRQILIELFPAHINEARTLYFYFWSKYIKNVQPFEGIPELLAGLQRIGLAIGTVTSRNGKDMSTS